MPVTNPTNLLSIRHYYSPVDIAFLAVSALATALLALVLPLATMVIFDKVLPAQSHSSLYLLLGLIILAVIFEKRISALEHHLGQKATEAFERGVSKKLFQRLILSPHASRSVESSINLEHIDRIREMRSVVSGDLANIWVQLTLGVMLLLGVGLVSMPAFIVISASSAFLAYLVWRLGESKVDLQSKKLLSDALINKKIEETIENAYVVKASAMEYRLQAHLLNLVIAREEVSAKTERALSAHGLHLQGVSSMVSVLIVFIGGMSVIDQSLSQGAMSAMILLANRYFSPLQQVLTFISRRRSQSALISTISSFMLDDVDSAPNKVEPSAILAARETDQQPPLEILSTGQSPLQCETSKVVALTGPSASGKTRLMMALWAGEHLKLDRLECTGAEPMTIMVHRESKFQSGSVLDALTCFDPTRYRAALNLCETLGIASEIHALKAGFLTEMRNGSFPVTRRTHFMLLIARALLSNNRLILIDDGDLMLPERVFLHLIESLKGLALGAMVIVATNSTAVAAQCDKKLALV